MPARQCNAVLLTGVFDDFRYLSISVRHGELNWQVPIPILDFRIRSTVNLRANGLDMPLPSLSRTIASISAVQPRLFA